MNQENVENPQNLTKKQRRELRKLKAQKDREKASKKAKVKKIIIGLVIIGILGGLIFLIYRRLSKSPESDSSNPYKGPENAQVVIEEYSDFQCPACAKSAKLISTLVDNYPNEVKLVFNNFPLTPIHPKAFRAAEASECAHEQGKFWEYHDVLFNEQNIWSLSDEVDKNFQKYAEDLKLDGNRFKNCLEQNLSKDSVEKDLKEAQRLGLNATPTFFINNQKIVGGKSLEEFKQIIEEELKK